jgi:hypothetical protein
LRLRADASPFDQEGFVSGDIHLTPLDEAVRILDEICATLPLRSIERDIVVCAQLYLMGDLSPGNSVARWWNGQKAGWWRLPGVLADDPVVAVEKSQAEQSRKAGRGQNMNPQNSRLIPVNPEQVKNQIKLLEAKLDMQKGKLKALIKHSDMTRRLVTYLSRYITHSPENTTPGPVSLWNESHKLQETAGKQIIEVQIAELESQIFIHKMMLDEAEKSRSGLVV